MKAETVKKIVFIRSITFFSVILIFGIAFSAGFLFLRKDIPENFAETKAEIVKIKKELSPVRDESDGIDDTDYDHTVFIEYSYNGKKYSNAEYPGYNSDMKEGGTVLIYVDPDNPEKFMGDPSDDFVFAIVGTVIVLIGAGGLIYTVYQKKKGE